MRQDRGGHLEVIEERGGFRHHLDGEPIHAGELLDYFAGWQRVGVPFQQSRYFPENFDESISISQF